MSFTIFLTLIIIVCFLLIITVMVQNPKSGGLSSSFGGGGQIGGVQKTTDFLEKATWALSGILVLLILLSGLGSNTATTESKLIDENAPAAVPTIPSKTKTNSTAPVATPSDTAK